MIFCHCDQSPLYQSLGRAELIELNKPDREARNLERRLKNAEITKDVKEWMKVVTELGELCCKRNNQ